MFSHTGEWVHFESLKSVILENKKHERSHPYVIEGFKISHGGGLIKFSGIDTPESAKTLAGLSILVPKEFAAPLGKNEWYHNDLIGLVVINEKNEEMGKIVSIIESSDELLEVSRSDGSRFMVPFRREFVNEPDLVMRTIVLMACWIDKR